MQAKQRVFESVLDTVGCTPLVRLNKMSPDPNIEIWVKLEMLNPSCSIKDRIVKHIIEGAEASGELRPGGIIVENTSGNTGAAVAMTAAVKGYKAILTMPDKVSTEKQNALKAYGAEIVVCPTSAPPDSPDHYENVAEALHEKYKDSPNGCFKVNQYDNMLNPEAHTLSTGPEIWEQMDGQIDWFVASGSTGGTISGIGKYLRSKDPNVKVFMPDPDGSCYAEFFASGKENRDKGCTYLVEGIGEDHVCGAMDFGQVSEVATFTDDQAFECARRLATEEGILAGGSSGANLWGCLQIAQRFVGTGQKVRIVTVLPDSGVKYLSKIYNNEWMLEHGLLSEVEAAATREAMAAAAVEADQTCCPAQRGGILAHVAALGTALLAGVGLGWYLAKQQ